MPNYKYTVELLQLKTVQEIPGAWNGQQFRGLLHHLEYDGVEEIPEDELKDMACMALSDFEKEEAVEKVLEFWLGDKLNKGQRKNLANEMQEDPLWVEYSDLSLHEELFHVGCILFWTFPRNFPSPEIAKLVLKISASNPDSKINLNTPTPSFLCRILKDGMDEFTIMNRLFDENLEGNSFPEAEHIIWQMEASAFDSGTNSVTITLYTSWNWVEDLKGIQKFESTAYADGQIN
ncbi:MAG: hypothetical protein HKO75_08760 [Flavobacteriaceae bacterium]|nr:hypothetical protein [Muriicola sp.]NNC60935.1 hypothetical protein [Eudoraea sp.]NNK21235.1 hypothetical protein [Flavobacteriaceae bacterium]MBT8289593.1 hypothetical protein [Muriicola sp.]NNK34786.1 hypothetical protein [Eudoraea sp.]